MTEGTFNISVLKNAAKRLNEVIIRYENDKSDDAIRDSVIQRFEFTYFIALKTLRKYFLERAFVIEDVNKCLLMICLEKQADFILLNPILRNGKYSEKCAT